MRLAAGEDHAEPNRDSQFLAFGTRSNLGHDGHSWLRGPYHHCDFAPQSAPPTTWDAALGELDIRNECNATCARWASRGDRSLGVRARYLLSGHRYQLCHLFVGW